MSEAVSVSEVVSEVRGFLVSESESEVTELSLSESVSELMSEFLSEVVGAIRKLYGLFAKNIRWAKVYGPKAKCTRSFK